MLPPPAIRPVRVIWAPCREPGAPDPGNKLALPRTLPEPGRAGHPPGTPRPPQPPSPINAGKPARTRPQVNEPETSRHCAQCPPPCHREASPPTASPSTVRPRHRPPRHRPPRHPPPRRSPPRHPPRPTASRRATAQSSHPRPPRGGGTPLPLKQQRGAPLTPGTSAPAHLNARRGHTAVAVTTAGRPRRSCCVSVRLGNRCGHGLLAWFRWLRRGRGRRLRPAAGRVRPRRRASSRSAP